LFREECVLAFTEVKNGTLSPGFHKVQKASKMHWLVTTICRRPQHFQRDIVRHHDEFMAR
jgi:hypothetical protein